MRSNYKLFRTIKFIVGLILIMGPTIIDAITSENLEKSLDSLEIQPPAYIAETQAQKIKPEFWDSVYLPSTLPKFYELGRYTMADTHISCKFSRYMQDNGDTSIFSHDPSIFFTQWNYKKETIPWEKSILPPILQTGKFQMYSSKNKTDDQLELQKNASLQTQTYNKKEYYFTNETQNGTLLLLWYDEQNTFALSVESEPNSQGNLKISLDDMLEIADQVKEYPEKVSEDTIAQNINGAIFYL